jgi:hypothetical protein
MTVAAGARLDNPASGKPARAGAPRAAHAGLRRAAGLASQPRRELQARVAAMRSSRPSAPAPSFLEARLGRSERSDSGRRVVLGQRLTRRQSRRGRRALQVAAQGGRNVATPGL